MPVAHVQPAVVRAPESGWWHGEPTDTYTGPLDEVARYLPTFGRTSFGDNQRLDMIFRRPAAREHVPMAIGTVSKRYVLVQHGEAIDALAVALSRVGVEPGGLKCRLTMSESGARMAMRVELPARFAFMPQDGHAMALTYECFNSVDRSIPLFAVLGWYRFVCTNGLIVGTTHARMRQRHVPPLKVEELEAVLADGLEDADRDRVALAELMDRRISTPALQAWVDGPLATAWGPYTAARVHAIVTTGRDGVPNPKPRAARPHERTMLHPVRVPGAVTDAANGYAVAQALAWVAARRREVSAGLTGRRQIAELIAAI